MSVDIGDSFRTGFQELLSPRGVVVAGLLVLYGLGDLVVQQSFSRFLNQAIFDMVFGDAAQDPAAQQAAQQAAEQTPFALEVGLPVILALMLVTLLVNELVRLVGIRLFASDSDDPIPFDDVTDGFADAAVKALVVGGAFGVVYAVVSAIPLLGWVVGPVLAVVFVYLRQVIALEDRGFAETISESVSLLTDDPVPPVVILAVLAVLGFAVGVPWPFVVDEPVVTAVVPAVLGAVVGAFGVAVVTDAYKQARAAADEAEAEEF